MSICEDDKRNRSDNRTSPLFKVNSPGKVVIDGRKNWKDNDRENIIGSIFLGDPTMPNADGELPKMGPAVVGDGLVTFLMELIHQCMQLCQDVSASIENRDDVGASLENFELRAKAFESILGIEMRKNSVGNDISHPKKLMDQILSNHVMLKK